MSRRPLPTQTKRQRGETRPSRTNKAEPEVRVGELPPPKGLSKLAKEHWLELVPKLAEAKILGHIDGDTLRSYCELYADSVWLGKEIQSATGSDRMALMARREKVFHALRLHAIEFGMTPAARSKVKTIDGGDQRAQDDEAFLGSGPTHAVQGGKR